MSYKIDPHSETWKAVEEQVSSLIESAVKRLESDLSELETAKFRERIRVFRGLLKLPTVSRPTEPESLGF